jgi:hypothetical protein
VAFVELTPDERASLQEALLKAFPSEGALKQVLFFHLGENLNEITGGNNLLEIVQSLIEWAEGTEKTPVLIDGARKVNAGNSKLRDFDIAYKARRSNTHGGDGIGSSSAPLTKAMRDQLRDILLKIPQSNSFEGRSAYLIGLPWAQGLNRSPTNTRQDLEWVIDQLNVLGQLDSGEWPLLLFIDNAASQVQGLRLGRNLSELREALAKAYKEAANAQ